jgi:hypothetical protein
VIIAHEKRFVVLAPWKTAGNADVSDAAADLPGRGGERYLNRMNARSIGNINALFREDFDLFGYDRQRA